MQAIFDAEWRMEALAGGTAAVAAFAAAAITPLYRFCFYRVGKDRDLCQDVVQEALLGAIAQLESYDPDRCGGDIFGWLTGLARNAIRRAMSRRPSATALEAIWLRMDRELLSLYGSVDSRQMDDDLLARAETRDMVNATMSQLPGRYGRALEAKYVQNKSVREIAATSGETEKAVESMLARAREAFRRTFLVLSQSLSVEAAY